MSKINYNYFILSPQGKRYTRKYYNEMKVIDLALSRYIHDRYKPGVIEYDLYSLLWKRMQEEGFRLKAEKSLR